MANQHDNKNMKRTDEEPGEGEKRWQNNKEEKNEMTGKVNQIYKDTQLKLCTHIKM